MRPSRLLVSVLLAFAVGCDGSDGTDAGGSVDGGTPLVDSGAGLDAGPPDGGSDGGLDSGTSDSGTSDSGASDGGTSDGGTSDGGFDGGGGGLADGGLDAAVDGGIVSPYDDCDSSRTCVGGLTCVGYVESIGLGKCVPTATLPGEGSDCSTLECGAGLLCAGLGRGFGLCLPDWMQSTFYAEVDGAIPDTGPGELIRTLTAYGLATVDMDVGLYVAIDHPAPGELKVYLYNSDGTEVLVYDGGAHSDPPGRIEIDGPVVGFSGDESVNGLWTLRVVDGAGGNAGTLVRWSIFIASRWD